MIIHSTAISAPPSGPIDRLRRSVPTLTWALAALTLVLLPLRLLSYGYLPPDDALRHAAKAVSGKTWPEILVMRPELALDHNPGWHWILASLHRMASWEPRTLVAFSVVTLFLLFAMAPLWCFKRPEAWVGSMALVMLVFPYFADRAFVGRPLLLTMAVSLILLSMWTRPEVEATWQSIALSVGLIALSVWVHGSWYLLALLPIAFGLAQLWRKALLLTLCWIGGSILGALPTGNPLAFLRQSILIPMLALGQDAPVNSLVGEFQPFAGGYPALILVGLVFLWHKLTKRQNAHWVYDPVLWMAFAGFSLGFLVLRFWLDWGLPALALWLARQIDEFLQGQMSGESWRRLAVTGVISLALVWGVSSDRGARWSQSGRFEALAASRPEHARWVPEDGGILYSVDLAVFYETFFRNPHAQWRYILGFEPSFMRPEDLVVYQEVWRTLNAVKASAPWVQRMTPADRFILRASSQNRPAIPALEWFYAVTNTWVGRLPRANPGFPP